MIIEIITYIVLFGVLLYLLKMNKEYKRQLEDLNKDSLEYYRLKKAIKTQKYGMWFIVFGICVLVNTLIFIIK